MQADQNLTQTQKDEAALWHVRRVGGSMTAAQEVEFDVWLNADMGNRLAFDQMRVLWGQVEEPASRLAAARSKQQSGFGKLRLWFSPVRTASAFAGMAACAALALFLNPDVIENMQADIVSSSDMVTDIELSDGSHVYLAANSAITTDFEHGRRNVALLRGQAFFDVTHRNGDRFRVKAGDATIEVVGTRFNVDYLTQNTRIGVEEGAVRVSTQTNSDGVLLGPGLMVALDAGRLTVSEGVDIAATQSWMHGRLSVRNMRVDDLVAQLDNFASGRFVTVGDIGDKTISGSFPTADIDRSLETLAAAMGAKLLKTSPWLTVIY